MSDLTDSVSVDDTTESIISMNSDSDESQVDDGEERAMSVNYSHYNLEYKDLKCMEAYVTYLLKSMFEGKKSEEGSISFHEIIMAMKREECQPPTETIGRCSICWDEHGVNQMAATKCGHVFCLQCIKQSLSIVKTCPNCRHLLNGRDAYHPIYLTD